jgi:hypothetical protein
MPDLDDRWWLKAASLCFGLWSLMVPISAKVIVDRLEVISTEQAEANQRLNTFILANERRITLLEERQSYVLRVLERADLRVNGGLRR